MLTRMNNVGTGIAFGSMVAGATAMEINHINAVFLWLLIALWALFLNWK